MADASDRAFTCVSGAVAERIFVYMAIANSNFGSVSFSVQRDAGSDGSLTAEKLERPVALGSFSHGLMKKMNAQNRGWRGGNDGASKIARSPIHDQEAGSKFCRIPSGGERILTSFVSSAVTGERFRGWCLSSTRSFDEKRLSAYRCKHLKTYIT